jgi:polyisoprenoid-binding protein YceI
MVHGRFNEFSGEFTIDKDPAASKFSLSIKVDSVDTNNEKRDEHLRAPDFFNTKQYPALTFESTKVKTVKGGYEVTGDLTMHGVTKPVKFTLKGGDKVIEFPPGTKRIGFVSDLTVKRSDFDMKTALDSLGDEIQVSIGIEATRE